MSFTVVAKNRLQPRLNTPSWQSVYELFSVCGDCGKSTTFVVSVTDPQFASLFSVQEPIAFSGGITSYFRHLGYIALKDQGICAPPDHTPDEIGAVFREGATCLAVECFNAAATMFRLCVDMATEPLLPDQTAPDGPNSRQRRDLGLRLQWLFERGVLPTALHDLALCIKEDGNDGAHRGSLKKEDAEDLLDFTEVLLDRLFAEPKRVEIANSRRLARRGKLDEDVSARK